MVLITRMVVLYVIIRRSQTEILAPIRSHPWMFNSFSKGLFASLQAEPGPILAWTLRNNLNVDEAATTSATSAFVFP